MSRRFGPKSAEHPSVGDACPACGQPLKEGDYTTLVAVGPGGDEEERASRDEGRPYNSVAVEVHWECGPYPNTNENTGGDHDR